MAKKGDQGSLSLMEAVDTLSSLAELDVDVLTYDTEDLVHRNLQWLGDKKTKNSVDVVKRSFQAVHTYMKNVAQQDEKHLQNKETQHGLQAIMLLAGEAAEKFDKCAHILFKGAKSNEQQTVQNEITELNALYHDTIVKRFHTTLSEELAWSEEFEQSNIDVHQVAKAGLKDLETVKKDREYELLYLKNEDNKPYINRNLLRHIKLVADFEVFLENTTLGDPFLRLKLAHAKDVQQTALEILERCQVEIKEFYQVALKFKENQLLQYGSKAIMSLMLASKDRSVIVPTAKTSLQYFQDFQLYFREGLTASDFYQYTESKVEDLDRIHRAIVQLYMAIANAIFTRSGNKGIYTNYLYELLSDVHGGLVPSIAWQDVLHEYDILAQFFKKYPNGPLLRTLDIFKNRDIYTGFDPYFQENLPSSIGFLRSKSVDTHLIRLPSPTHQELISEANVIPEFELWIRGVLREPTATVLIITNQNPTDQIEYARVVALEKMLRSGFCEGRVHLLILPKKTAFYEMKEEYLRVDALSVFFDGLENQLLGGHATGYSIPKPISKKKYSEFIKNVVTMLRKHFIAAEKQISRRDRLMCIDFCYQAISLWMIQELNPSITAFSCKDAIDASAASIGGFIGFIQCIAGKEDWSEEIRDLFIWATMTPALVYRDRLIDNTIISRLIAAIASWDDPKKKKRSHIQTIYEQGTHTNIRIEEV